MTLTEDSARDLLAKAASTIDASSTPRTDLVRLARRRHHRNLGAAVVGVAAAALITGVALAGGQQSVTRQAPAPATNAPVSTPSDGPAQHGRVGVPILEEYTKDEALQRAEDWGLAARVVQRFQACRPQGMVIDQMPGAGSKVLAGSVVTIVIADSRSAKVPCGQGVASKHDYSIASLLYSFSQNPHTNTAPWASRVTLSASNGQVNKTLTEQQAEDPRQWRLDAPSAQGSILDVLASSQGQFRVDLDPHSRCVGQQQPPPDLFKGLRQVSITPKAPHTSCLNWWAVDFYLNDVGQIQGVSLDQWEP